MNPRTMVFPRLAARPRPTAVAVGVALLLCTAAASPLAAQYGSSWIQWLVGPPSPYVGTSHTVQVEFGGYEGDICLEYDANGNCLTFDYYTTLVNTTTFRIALDGVLYSASQFPVGPPDRNCQFFPDNTWECREAYLATGTATFASGTHVFDASVEGCDDPPGCTITHLPISYAFTAQSPTAITVDPAPHNGAYRDATKCVAACFDATVSYTTPAYFSMDTPRSVTLLYRGGQATPLGFVQVDATDTTSPAPNQMSIRLQRPDASWVTFTNGSQEIFYTAGSGTSRLAAQFDAAGLATGAYSYTVVARSWRGTSSQETTQPVRVLIVNEQSSPFGAGWSIPGLQRLYVQGDGSVLITEGDGSVTFFFNYCGTDCALRAPPGDFSTVTALWPSGYERRYTDGTVVAFASSGLMTSVRDRLGNQTSYGYDPSNRLSTITDPASKVITLGYGADGKLDFIQDPGSRSTLITINGAGELTEIKDPQNVFALRPSYAPEHQMIQRLDRRGSAWRFVYDFAGKLAADSMPTITADGQSVRPVIQLSSPERAVLVDPASGLGTSGSPAPRVLPANVRASTTNPRGFTTQYTLDRFGAPTRIEEPLGRITKLARNAQAQVTADTTPSGHVTEYTWTGPNLTKVVDRTTGRTVNIEYEFTYNQVLKIYGDIDTVVNVWSGGKLTSTRRANRSATTYLYDARGRVTQKTDPNSHVTTFHYAATGWQNTDSLKPGGRRTAYTYDSYGRVATVKNPLDHVSTIGYDLTNRTTRTIGPLSPPDTTAFDYDSLYVRSVRDAKGQVYQFSRNALGWVEMRTDPAGARDNYAYDRNGNLKSSTNRRGQTVTFTYDELDHLLSRLADGQTTTYSADPLDRFTAAGNAGSIDSLKLDIAGRVSHQLSVRQGTRYELQATYNNRDIRTLVQVNSPWAASIAYHYNDNMLLDTLTDVSGARTSLTYDADLLPNSATLPMGLTVTRAFPATHTPQDMTFSNAGVNAALGGKYHYNAAAQLDDRSKIPPEDGGRDFGYDPLMRLTSCSDYTWQTPPPTGCDWWCDGFGCRWFCASQPPPEKVHFNTQTFSYDKVGNRTDLNALVALGNRLVKFDGDSLVYDADGNLTKRIRAGQDVQRLYWNTLGQLVAAWTSGEDSVNFAYDGFGRRTSKWKATANTRYVYDGFEIFAEVDAATGNRIAEYTYYPWVDQPSSVRLGGPTGAMYYYAQDFPGNVTGLISSSGTLVNQYRYTPFGANEAGYPQESVPNSLRFSARQFDTETGLYYVRARYYDPAVGRFISEDPIGLSGGINSYSYARNNPANEVDPSGLCAGPLAAICAAGAAGALAGGYFGVKAYLAATTPGSRGAFGFVASALGGAAIGGIYSAGAAAVIELGVASGQVPEALVLTAGLFVAMDAGINRYVDVVVEAERRLNNGGRGGGDGLFGPATDFAVLAGGWSRFYPAAWGQGLSGGGLAVIIYVLGGGASVEVLQPTTTCGLPSTKCTL